MLQQCYVLILFGNYCRLVRKMLLSYARYLNCSGLSFFRALLGSCGVRGQLGVKLLLSLLGSLSIRSLISFSLTSNSIWS